MATDRVGPGDVTEKATGRFVVVGGSAGALGPLRALCGGLPLGFPAPILAVLHLSPTYPSRLPGVLTTAGPLPATYPSDGEKPMQGRIYVAPPDRHLVVDPDGSVRVGCGPCTNGFRPSIDVLFRSAAEAWGSATIAVVLSGALSDGAAGAAAVGRAGGTVLVQDPDDATLDVLPREVLRTHEPDMVLSAAEIPTALQRLATEAEPASPAPPVIA